MAGYDYDLLLSAVAPVACEQGVLLAPWAKRSDWPKNIVWAAPASFEAAYPRSFSSMLHSFEHFEDAAGYGWEVGKSSFDWKKLIEAKDKEITRLEGLYRKGLENSKVEIFASRAELIDEHTIELKADGRRVTADQILIATGGHPSAHEALPGNEYCISSNEAFHLEELPKAIVIAGGGYIAVEFANIFHGLRSKPRLFIEVKKSSPALIQIFDACFMKRWKQRVSELFAVRFSRKSKSRLMVS